MTAPDTCLDDVHIALEDLAAFNVNIVGQIEEIATFEPTTND
jgi:hypothetical protein